MGTVTILWSLAAGVALTLAAVCAALWAAQRDDYASLILSVLGLAVATSALCEIGLMHSATPAQYGEWLRWYHLPVFSVLVSQLLFIHFYLGTGRRWLLWTLIAARSVILLVNFTVRPNFNFVSITALRPISFLGEPISGIGAAIARTAWQDFATATLVLFLAYLLDAAVQRWRLNDERSKREALIVGLGVAVPWLVTVTYTQSVVFGFAHLPISNLPWFLGALVVMASELVRDFVATRRAAMELAELRGQLMRIERISMVTQLSSAVAHELAQPLTANAINAEAALKHLERSQPDIQELREILTDIGSNSRRGVELVAHMRRLFKSRDIEMKPLSLYDLVQDVTALVGPEATAKQVVLSLQLGPGLPLVMGDRVHLSQVLLNLILNGIQAVQSRPANARFVAVEARPGNETGDFEITVRDSGEGIPAAVAGKLFGPFFTTKPDGMGIGLTLSRMIVEAHGGRLRVDGASGQSGAVFRFTLRRAPAAQAEGAVITGSHVAFEPVASL